MARILMVGSEAAPYVKTGGLADVLGALPAALVKQGHEVAVLIPRYRSVDTRPLTRIWDELHVPLGPYTHTCSVFQEIRDGVRFLFLNQDWFYDRDGGPYGYGNTSFGDNYLRFGLLCKAALLIRKLIFPADIIHTHDWQAGLVGPYLSQVGIDPGLVGVKLVHSIHNLGYQGIFGGNTLYELGLGPEMYSDDSLKFYDAINFMKGGIVYSHAVTTVSPRYAQEIQTPPYGFQLDGLLRKYSYKLTGILNGVDYSEWDPQNDRYLPASYSPGDLSGKAVCKKALLDELGMNDFPPAWPIIGIVSRFADQKGLDILMQIEDDLFSNPLGLVVLGSGEPFMETYFRSLENRKRDRVRSWIGYNNRIAHLIEAGADMFLMPSRYEPCGLNQIYSLRYGTVPIVRATGGLDDTINGENGFKFWGFYGGDLMGAVRYALAEYAQPDAWKQRIVNGMQANHSWDVAARGYNDLYGRLRG